MVYKDVIQENILEFLEMYSMDESVLNDEVGNSGEFGWYGLLIVDNDTKVNFERLGFGDPNILEKAYIVNVEHDIFGFLSFESSENAMIAFNELHEEYLEWLEEKVIQ